MPIMGYQLKFMLNVARNTRYSEVKENTYFQSIEITLMIRDMSKGFVLYQDIETKMSSYLDVYSGKLLNTTPPFDYLDPTLENIALFFYDQLKIILLSMNLILFKLEIRDISTRTFSISEEDIISQKVRKLNLLVAEHKNLKKEVSTMKGGK